MTRRSTAAAALILLLSSCGGGGDSRAEPEREAATSTAGVPACDATATHSRTPRSFPAEFPLPKGTVITSTGEAAGGTFVRGVVPLSLEPAAAFFRRRVPAAGFTPGEADAEPWEAESEFSGRGVEGKWKVNELPACPGKAALLVAVAPD